MFSDFFLLTGQLGDGSTTNRLRPVAVDMSDISDMSLATFSTCVVAGQSNFSSQLLCVGGSFYGEAGSISFVVLFCFFPNQKLGRSTRSDCQSNDVCARRRRCGRQHHRSVALFASASKCHASDGSDVATLVRGARQHHTVRLFHC